jgi:hypothetical protein
MIEDQFSLNELIEVSGKTPWLLVLIVEGVTD